MDKTKYKIYRESAESWFYRNFVKKTVNDNFFTSTEVLDKESNQELIRKVKSMPLKRA